MTFDLEPLLDVKMITSPDLAHQAERLPASEMEDAQLNNGSMLSYPRATDSYTPRMPTPPRIVVPPPSLNADAVPDITLHALRNNGFEFLQNVDYDNLVRQNAPLEWSYERRREAQGILPFLCLGPMAAAKDEAWLKREGVTMLLGINHRTKYAEKLMNSTLQVAEMLGIEHHVVDLASNQDLIQALPSTTSLINNHLSRRYQETGRQSMGKVLVFCESGNERAAGVVAAYLMETHKDFDHINAMQLCQAQRFSVNFDDGLKRLLQSYWDILCAKRTVAENSMSKGNTKRRLKRDDEDDGMTAESDTPDADDVERFGGRKFAPFIDVPM